MARIARMLSAGTLGVALSAAVPAWSQVPPFAAFKSFVPATILSGNPTKLTIQLQNINSVLTASAIRFTDSFPAGMVLVPGVDPAFQCGGLAVTGGIPTT
jgi:uncharacterized repeat protein (TIGR01451 family)